MAIFHQARRYNAKLDQCEVIQYLLNGAWDIENSNRAQIFLWGAGSASASDELLGQSFKGEFYIGGLFLAN